MKHFFYSLALLVLSARFVHAQTTATTTIVADRYANPTLQWQGVYANYQGPTVGWSYSINNGSFLNAKSIATGSEYYYGRYNFVHPSFPNSKITKITLSVNCTRDPSTTSGPAIAKITVPNCSSVAWSSGASGQSLYSCLNSALPLQSDLSISTNNDGSSPSTTYLIHDLSQGIDNSNLWTASATSLAIGLKPWQNAMNINSISITITYLQDAVPAIANNVICCAQTLSTAGTPARLYPNSGNPTGGTGSYTYQWQSSTNNSSWSNISGATAFDYYPPTIYQTNYYRRIVSSGTATPNTSAAVKITVYTAITGNTIGNNQSFLNTGNPSALFSTATVGGGDDINYNYQWQTSTDNVTFTTISGAIGSSYTPPALTQTAYYRRSVSSVGFSSTSNVVTISVAPGISGNLICCNQTFINSGDPVSLSQTSGTTLNAGSGYSTQWLSSTDNITYTSITGAYLDSYDPPVTTQTIYYKRQITHSSGIVNTSPAVTISITTDPDVLNNTIGYSQSFISNGDPAAFYSTATLGGGNGTYHFIWKSSTDNLNWTTVGTDSPGYDAALLSVTTYFQRIVTSGTARVNISNTVSININPMGACQNQWLMKTPIGIDRDAGFGLSVNNFGYVGMGSTNNSSTLLNDVRKYDPSSDVWTTLASFPGTARRSFYYFALNNKIYVGLGYSASSTILKDFWEFNPVTNSWVKKADFPFPVYTSENCSFALGNFAYIITGNAVYEYSPGDESNGYDTNGNPKGTWIQKQTLPVAGSSYNSFTIGNRAYISVFLSSGTTNLYEFQQEDLTNGCDVKNKAKGSWIQRASVPAINYNGANYLFTLSGKAYLQDGPSTLIQYTPETDSYTSFNIASPMQTSGAAAFSVNNIGYTNFRIGASGPYYFEDQQFWQFSLSGIATGSAPVSLKAGNTFTLPFTLACGKYNSPVVFNAQLSDASGSFANPVAIGTVTTNTSSAITATIPLTTVTGANYRVRVVSVSPSEIGSDNGINIPITDQFGNTSDLFYNYEDAWQKQWVNKSSNGATTGRIGAHAFKDSDIFYSGDFDGDGTQEMLIVSYTGGSNDYMDVVKYVNGEWVSVWSNNGSSSPGIYPYRTNLIVGDFDGDGKDEVLGNSTWTTMFRFINNDWVWSWSDNGNTSHPMYPYKNKFYAGNFYADGKTQILGCSGGDWTTMFSWNGSNFVWGWSDYGGANPFRYFRSSLIIGDFNGDGRSDLFAQGPANAFVFQYNATNSQYSQVWSTNGSGSISGWTYPFAASDKVMAANIDSDSKTELILVKKNGPNAYTMDFDGSSGWSSNFQYAFIGDWNVSPPLNTSNSNYTMVKPRAGEPSFVLAMRKTCGGVYTSAMYKTSTIGFNYKTGTGSGNEKQIAANQIFVYPNPSDQAFDVYIQNGNARQLSVFNYSGEEMYTIENKQALETLNVDSNNWPNGIYLIKVLTEHNELLTSKMIIQH